MGTAGAMLVLVLGMVFGTGKIEKQTLSFTGYIIAVCAIMAIGLALFIAFVREPKWAKEMQEESDRLGLDTVSDEVEDASNGEVKSTDVGNNGGFKELFRTDRSKFNSLMLILASVALWYIGYNAASTKYSLYATNVLHKDFNTTLLIAQAAAIVAYLPAGALSKKIGRKNSILFGVAILTAAFFSITFFTDKTPLFFINLAFIIGGIGWATINVNSFPMVVEIAKGGNVGKYTGYYYTASMAAQIVTPILSGWIMELFGNMSPLFYYSTIFIGAAFITMMFVKHGDAKKEEEIIATIE
jgi:Na+/melibiose symporter-like transporter